MSREGERSGSEAKRAESRRRERVSKGHHAGTVLKPTQVGEKSILRRSSDSASRNSAIYTRNFGRSVAPARGLQRNGPNDCLTKTQVSANLKRDV